MSDFESKLKEILLKYDIYPLDWSINNPTGVEEGIDFHIIKIGEGNCGLVISGFVLSNCRYDEEYKRYCRWNYKTDCEVTLAIREIFHPDRSEIVTLEEIQEALQNIQFDGSRSEFILNNEQSTFLWKLRERFISDHPNIFKPKVARLEMSPRP